MCSVVWHCEIAFFFFFSFIFLPQTTAIAASFNSIIVKCHVYTLFFLHSFIPWSI